jgi:cholesterol transport system auxiliary component
MKLIKIFLSICLLGSLSACSLGPVNTSQVQTYALHADNTFGQTTNQRNSGVILVVGSTATGNFYSTNMYYQEHPYQLQSFAKSAWLNMPSAMIVSNIGGNLTQLRYFKAVLTNLNPGVAVTYTLNMRLINLYQDFTHQPSQMVLSIALTLINNAHHKVLAAQTFNYVEPCTQDTPYGGVIAANKALAQFLNDMDRFVLTATASN